MKRLLFLLMLTVGIILSSVSLSFALSDADYKKYKQESVKFALADKDLGQIWGLIKSTNRGKIPSALMAEQKQWIQVDRDTEAQKLFSTMSPADAYATVTNQRIEVLRTKWLFGNNPSTVATKTPNREQFDGDELSGVYKCKNVGGDIKIQLKGNNEYNVTIGLYRDLEGAVGASMFTDFTGTGTLIDGVLTVKNQEKRPDYELVIGKGWVKKQTSSIVSGTLKIYTQQHHDVTKYGDNLINEGNMSNDQESKKYSNARGNAFKNMKAYQISIIDDDITFVNEQTKEEVEFIGVSFYNTGQMEYPLSGVYTKKK
ncbi:hypothetical protein LJC15_03970 [Desulfovibrio sp. OttesenSCG-928-G11]|nr:hypothetical protein [Desulfovibrio sp. OttesenSCG-928-G11]